MFVDKLNLSTFSEPGLQEIPGDYMQASKNKASEITCSSQELSDCSVGLGR